MTRAILLGATLTVFAGLSGCVSDEGLATPPRAKPARLPVQLEGPLARTETLGSVETSSGELLILEPDGSVSKTKIDSPTGRNVLRQSEEAMFSLTDVLTTDDSVVLDDLPRQPTAQEIAIEDFAGRTRSALPEKLAPTPAEAFLDNRVRRYVAAGGSEVSGLVSVLVNLRPGVDESVAFAYATCTLAAWSRSTDTPYARHIRTLSRETDKALAVEAVYTMSKTAPLGLRVMERQQTLQECRTHGIPTRLTVGPQEGTEKNG